MNNEQEPEVHLEAADSARQLRRRSWLRQHYLLLLILSSLVIITLVMYFLSGVLGDVEAYGYLGIFLISLVASAVIVIPIPAIVVVFGMGAVLNPWLVGLMVGLAEPIGELPAYMAGYSGRLAFENSRFYGRLAKWMKQRIPLVLFLLSAVPNWFFDLAAAGSGALRYPLWKFLLVVFLGKLVKGWIVAFAGYWTLRLLLQHFVG